VVLISYIHYYLILLHYVYRYGRIETQFAGYLAEFSFKLAYPIHQDGIHPFFGHVGKMYPPDVLFNH